MAVIKLSPDTYLSTDDGIIITEEQAANLVKTAVLRQKNLTVNKVVARIDGRDQQIIDFNLKGLNENITPIQGFLVTVYLSGSDGSLKRIYQRPIIDPADLSVVRGSFTDYINLELDV